MPSIEESDDDALVEECIEELGALVMALDRYPPAAVAVAIGTYLEQSGDSPITIAHQHGRTLRAIEARLEKLGLITAEQRTTLGGFTGAD